MAASSGRCGKRSKAAEPITRAAASASSADSRRCASATPRRAVAAWDTVCATMDRASARRASTSFSACWRASSRAWANRASTWAGAKARFVGCQVEARSTAPSAPNSVSKAKGTALEGQVLVLWALMSVDQLVVAALAGQHDVAARRQILGHLDHGHLGVIDVL